MDANKLPTAEDLRHLSRDKTVEELARDSVGWLLDRATAHAADGASSVIVMWAAEPHTHRATVVDRRLANAEVRAATREKLQALGYVVVPLIAKGDGQPHMIDVDWLAVDDPQAAMVWSLRWDEEDTP